MDMLFLDARILRKRVGKLDVQVVDFGLLVEKHFQAQIVDLRVLLRLVSIIVDLDCGVHFFEVYLSVRLLLTSTPSCLEEIKGLEVMIKVAVESIVVVYYARRLGGC